MTILQRGTQILLNSPRNVRGIGSSSSRWVDATTKPFGGVGNDTDGVKLTVPAVPTAAEGSVVESEEELQPYWKQLESRVIRRKVVKKDGTTPTGRGKRNPSAWDHEHV